MTATLKDGFLAGIDVDGGVNFGKETRASDSSNDGGMIQEMATACGCTARKHNSNLACFST